MFQATDRSFLIPGQQELVVHSHKHILEIPFCLAERASAPGLVGEQGIWTGCTSDKHCSFVQWQNSVQTFPILQFLSMVLGSWRCQEATNTQDKGGKSACKQKTPTWYRTQAFPATPSLWAKTSSKMPHVRCWLVCFLFSYCNGRIPLSVRSFPYDCVQDLPWNYNQGLSISSVSWGMTWSLVSCTDTAPGSNESTSGRGDKTKQNKEYLSLL